MTTGPTQHATLTKVIEATWVTTAPSPPLDTGLDQYLLGLHLVPTMPDLQQPFGFTLCLPVQLISATQLLTPDRQH